MNSGGLPERLVRHCLPKKNQEKNSIETLCGIEPALLKKSEGQRSFLVYR